VQISVVVARIKIKTLNAEVEEVFVLTVFAHGLVGPKKQRNCVECHGFAALGLRSKEHASFERESGQYSRTWAGCGGNANDHPDIYVPSWKSSLFFLIQFKPSNDVKSRQGLKSTRALHLLLCKVR